MKVKSSIKRICSYCQVIRRGKKIMVNCLRNKRHKQRQGFSTLNFGNFKVGDPNFCGCSSQNEQIHEICSKELKSETTLEDLLSDLNRNI